jgi:hypothetical protein
MSLEVDHELVAAALEAKPSSHEVLQTERVSLDLVQGHVSALDDRGQAEDLFKAQLRRDNCLA